MNIVLDGGTGGIVSADLGPAFEPPAPIGNSFNFTGIVSGISPIQWGPPLPVPIISLGDEFQGTLTYDTSSFIKNQVGDNFVQYLPGPSTIASIQFSFGSGQEFYSTNMSYDYSGVYNDYPSANPDQYLFSAFIYPNPSLAVLDNDSIVNFILVDSKGTALSSLDYPTNLNFGDWTERIFQFILKSGSSQYGVSGILTSLYSAGSPTIALASSPPADCHCPGLVYRIIN
jgi:hypothetical protein